MASEMRKARILTEADMDQILNLERKRLSLEFGDDMMAQMQEWHARWRKECLEHYLPKAWCFGIFQGEELKSYFLAQVLLFFQGHMQVMWLEHLQTAVDYVGDIEDSRNLQFAIEDKKVLIDIAYKYAREKHLQKLMFDQKSWIDFLPTNAQYKINADLIELATTKSL